MANIRITGVSTSFSMNHTTRLASARSERQATSSTKLMPPQTRAVFQTRGRFLTMYHSPFAPAQAPRQTQ